MHTQMIATDDEFEFSRGKEAKNAFHLTYRRPSAKHHRIESGIEIWIGNFVGYRRGVGEVVKINKWIVLCIRIEFLQVESHESSGLRQYKWKSLREVICPSTHQLEIKVLLMIEALWEAPCSRAHFVIVNIHCRSLTQST